MSTLVENTNLVKQPVMMQNEIIETENQRREQTKIGQEHSISNKSKIILKRKMVEDTEEFKNVEPDK